MASMAENCGTRRCAVRLSAYERVLFAFLKFFPPRTIENAFSIDALRAGAAPDGRACI